MFVLAMFRVTCFLGLRDVHWVWCFDVYKWKLAHWLFRLKGTFRQILVFLCFVLELGACTTLTEGWHADRWTDKTWNAA